MDILLAIYVIGFIVGTCIFVHIFKPGKGIHFYIAMGIICVIFTVLWPIAVAMAIYDKIAYKN